MALAQVTAPDTYNADVVDSAEGSRVLVATANFAALVNPSVQPDFKLTNPIPAAYLAAGRLTHDLRTANQPSQTMPAPLGTVSGGMRSIAVTKPTSATSVNANQSFVIKWRSTGNLSAKLRVDLFKGSNKIDTIAVKTENDGKLRWTVPSGLENDNSYRIRVLNKVTGTSDKSEAFTITSP